MLRRKRAERRLPPALVLGWVCLAFASLSPGAEPPSFNGARAFEDLKHLVDFGPRPSGSPALTQTRQWLIQELRGTGAEVEEDSFVGNTPIGAIPMDNLIAKFGGSGRETVIVAGHYDTKRFDQFRFLGANDGGSSAALLVELARVLGARRNSLNYWLVFFDGEEAVGDWSATDSLYGSRHLVEKLSSNGELSRIRALILVDMIGDAQLRIPRESNSTPWLSDLVFNVAQRLGYSKYFVDGQNTIDDDHIPFINTGVSAVDLIDFNYGPHNSYWHSAKDTLDHCSPESLTIVGRVVTATLIELEKIPPKELASTMGQSIAWMGFVVLVLALLGCDVGIFNRKPQVISSRAATLWSSVWVFLAIIFCASIYFWRGPHDAVDFLTAYLIEESLSLDNLLVFVVIFTSAAVALQYQRRVLFWGILGALVTRGLFVFGGLALISHFHWILYVLGIFLVVAAARLLRKGRGEFDPMHSRMLTLTRKLLPITPTYEGGKFFVRREGRLFATPLLLVLLMIEMADVAFAVDSVPAVFSVTQDAFIVYTSNVFAVLGLRALYFLLAGAVKRFRYLRRGLAGVLVFVGVKMLMARIVRIPTGWALLVILVAVTSAVTASLLRKESDDH